jgi:hypothetical protein
MSATTPWGEPRASFYANSHATGWWWYPRMFGAGFLHCFDGVLRFQSNGVVPRIGPFFKDPVWEHRSRRVVLSSPSMPIPGHFTIVTLDGGAVSCSIPGQQTLLRSTLADCGFEVVDTPPRRSWPRNHRLLWHEYGATPPAAGGPSP